MVLSNGLGRRKTCQASAQEKGKQPLQKEGQTTREFTQLLTMFLDNQPLVITERDRNVNLAVVSGTKGANQRTNASLVSN